MRANVPLAAPVAQDQNRDQNQERHSERVLVSPPRATSLGEPAWEAFYAVVYVASTILVEAAPLTAGLRIAAGAALAAMVPWYFLLGRPVMRLDEPTWPQVVTGWRGPAYLIGMIALFAVADHANPSAWFLAFALSPQCFQMTAPIRRAMAFVIVLNLVGGLMVVLASHTAQNIATAVGTVLFAIAFSVVYSRWTIRVIEQSRERAALIAQLESAQAELAAAYHEAGVYAERQRLAAEIHDTLAQGFLSIVTLIQAAQASRATAAPSIPAPSAPGPGVSGPGVSGLNGSGPDVPGPSAPGSDGSAMGVPGLGVPGQGLPGLNGSGLGASDSGVSGLNGSGPGASGPGEPGSNGSGPGVPGPSVADPSAHWLSVLNASAPDVVGDYLELAVATARENLAEARTLVAALAPASLDDVGLAGAVARAAGATGKATGIEATCAAEGVARPLPAATEVVLLRVCQEALANVSKHAVATRVDVRLRYTARTVELAVADNGCGFTAVVGPAAAKTTAESGRSFGTGATGVTGAVGAAATTRTTEAGTATRETGATATGASVGFGLRGMGERVRQVGGTLTVATAPGAGTIIRAEVPA